MAMCKFCGVAFAWGQKEGGGWVPLVPIQDHEGLDRSFQDENGVLRADHRIICVARGGPTVRVSKLARPVKAGEIIGTRVDQDTGEILQEGFVGVTTATGGD